MKIVLAYLTFVGFVPFAFLMFQRLPKAQAAAVSVLVGSILLPEKIAIDLPAVPPIDKEYLTYLTTLAAAFIYQRTAILRAGPGRGLELVLIFLFITNVGTAQMNGQPMMDEGKLEDGLGFYWLIAATADDLLTLAIPFFIGRALFTSLDDLYVFMRTLVIAATGYTVLVTIEVLMNIPFKVWQLSQVLFGLPARVNMRWGMAQPVVFFDNGLALATFMAVALIASAAIVKAGLPLPRVGRKLGIPKIGSRTARNVLTAGLLMSRNVAGVVYGMSFLLAYLFGRPRLVLLAGVSLITLGCAYPSLRMMDLFPYEAIVEFAAQYDEERAYSLEGRFLEEEQVLSQIGDRLWLGWGNIMRVPGAESFGKGEIGLDGWWTIRLGVSGILGVALYYVIFAVPVLRTVRRIGLAERRGGILIGGLVCMISIRMIDLIINGWWNCLPLFLCGVLMGVTGNLKRGSRIGGPPRRGPPPTPENRETGDSPSSASLSEGLGLTNRNDDRRPLRP
jgi:hypothetical protein